MEETVVSYWNREFEEGKLTDKSINDDSRRSDFCDTETKY